LSFNLSRFSILNNKEKYNNKNNKEKYLVIIKNLGIISQELKIN